jgi:uncharacterized protein
LERIQVIDILRGFALFGILLVNMELFSHPVQQVMLGHDELAAFPDRLAAWGIKLLAETKFYPIFSFLFGVGFALQILRAEQRGTRFVPFYLRRLFVLLLIGMAHAIFVWVGDILVLYAILGAILLLFFRRRAPRTLLIWTVVMLLLSVLVVGGLVGLALLARLTPEGAAQMSSEFAASEATLRAAAAQAKEVYATGSFGAITAQRLSDLGLAYSLYVFLGFNAFAMFLLGLYAGRRGIFRDIPAHVPLLRKILWWGIPVGLGSQLVYVVLNERFDAFEPSWGSLVANLAQFAGAPVLALVYVAGVTLLVQHGAWHARLRPLAAVGRMAMTNYLLQSLVATMLFYGYGFGLFGSIGPALGLLITIAIFCAQIPLSVLWLHRFQFGPVEWLWRVLTYMRWQPLLVQRSRNG